MCKLLKKTRLFKKISIKYCFFYFILVSLYGKDELLMNFFGIVFVKGQSVRTIKPKIVLHKRRKNYEQRF